MVRSLPRIDFGVVDSSIVVQSGKNLAIVLIDPAVDEKACLAVESLPVRRIASELVRIEESNHCFALLPPFHVSVRSRFGRRTGAVNASMLFVEAVSKSVIDEGDAGTTDLGIVLSSDALGCLGYQPTGFEVQTVFALFGVTVAVGDTPVVVEVIAAIADIGIDNLVHENVEKFVEACLNLLIASNAVKRCQCFYQAQ